MIDNFPELRVIAAFFSSRAAAARTDRDRGGLTIEFLLIAVGLVVVAGLVAAAVLGRVRGLIGGLG